jgi:uncharacterized protein (TIGR00304 family)
LKPSLIALGFILIFIGVMLVFAGMVSEVFKEKEVRSRGAGIVMIGPFPVIFGTDTEAVKTVVILTILLILIAFLFMTRWSY